MLAHLFERGAKRVVLLHAAWIRWINVFLFVRRLIFFQRLRLVIPYSFQLFCKRSVRETHELFAFLLLIAITLFLCLVNVLFEVNQLTSQVLSIDECSNRHAVAKDLLGLLKLLFLRAIQIDVGHLLNQSLSLGRGL